MFADHGDFATAQGEHLGGELAHFAIAKDDYTGGGLEMHLFQHLKIGGEWFDENGFFVADVVGDEMEICDGEGQEVGECSVAVDDTEGGAIRAVGGHVALAIEAGGLMAGGVNVADDALAEQVLVLFLGNVAVDCFDDADKFVAENAMEIHIAADDFEVGVADAGE